MARTDSIKPISSSLRLPSYKQRTATVTSQQSHVLSEKLETDSISSFVQLDVEGSDKSTLQLLVNLLMKVKIFCYLKRKIILFFSL
jgi:hypothetical protein